MVYDGQPIHDHFKRVDDDTVMGIMNGKARLQDGRLRLLLPATRLRPWLTRAPIVAQMRTRVLIAGATLVLATGITACERTTPAPSR